MSQRMTRRALLRGAAVASVGIILAACQPKPTATPEPTKAPPTAAPKAPEPTKAPQPTTPAVGGAIAPRGVGAWGGGHLVPAPKKYTPELKISIGFSFWQNDFKAPPGKDDTPQDNVVLRHVRDNTGVWFDQWVRGDSTQAFNTALAAGDMPEIVNFLPSAVAFQQLIDGNAIEDIRSVWEATASPLVKRNTEWPHNKMCWRASMRGEKLYALAGPGPTAWCDRIFWFRKELLDKVGLPVPKTVSEFYNAGLALKKANLVEIPFGFGNAINSWFASWDPIFGAYGAVPGVFTKVEGKLTYGSIRPENAEALEELRKWYKDGIVSPEWPTKDWTKWKQDLDAGKIGVFSMCGNQWQVANLMQNVPSVQFVHVVGPAHDKTGKRGRAGTAIYGLGSYVFKKGIDPKKIEAMINVKNWGTERNENAVQNTDFKFQEAPGSPWQFEGYDFEWEGDKIKPGPLLGQKTFHYTRVHEALTGQDEFLNVIKRVDAIKAKPEGQRNAIEQYIATQPMNQWDAYKLAYEYRAEATIPENQGLIPGKAQSEKWGDLAKFELEWYTKCIVGDVPTSDFPKFVEEWKKRGGEEVTNEISESLAKLG